MEVLNVGGKEYVKASVIARELGYTADYVGQLCRGRKVNAKLVGRSWYVDRDSMDLHKTGKYRGSQAKTKEALKEQVTLRLQTDGTKSKFYRHTPTKVSYEEDRAELIPAVGTASKKKNFLSVGLADATSVNIVSKSSSFDFTAPELPPIRFKGALSVTDYEETENTENTEGTENTEDTEVTVEETHTVHTVSIHPKEVSEFKKKPKNIAISAKSLELKKKGLSAGVLRPRLEKASDVTDVAAEAMAPQVESMQVAHVEIVETSESISVSRMPIYFSALLAVCIALVLVGLEASITFTADHLTTSYLFGIDHLTASSYSAYESFESAFYLAKFSTNFFIF